MYQGARGELRSYHIRAESEVGGGEGMSHNVSNLIQDNMKHEIKTPLVLGDILSRFSR